MEKIGLQGVMDLTNFTGNINIYNQQVNHASDNTEKKAGLMSRAFKGVGDVVKTGLGTAFGFLTAQAIPKVIDGIGKAISAGSDLNEAINASQVVFGDASDQIIAFGETAARTTGLTAADFNQMGAQLGALLTNFGLNQDDAAKATINLTQRAADMASIFNTDVSEAMLAVQAGLRGETEPLRRFGVDVSDAAVQAYALANGMLEAGEKMDNQTKIAARMGLIYEQTNKIAGDFVNTSDGLANSTRIQEAEWQNFLATMGRELLPVVTEVKQEFMKFAMDAMPVMIQAVKDAIPVIKEIWGWIKDNLIPIIAEVIKWLAENLPPAVQTAIEWFKQYLLPALSDIWAFVQDTLLPTLGKIIAWLGPIVQGALTTFKNDIWPWLSEAFSKVVDFIEDPLMPTLGKIVAWLGTIIKGAITVFKEDVWPGIKTAFKVASDFVTDTLLPVFGDVVDFLKTGFDAGVAAVKAAWGIIKGAIQGVVDVIKWIIDNAARALELLGLINNSKPSGGSGGGSGGSEGGTESTGPGRGFAGTVSTGGGVGMSLPGSSSLPSAGSMQIYNNRNVNIYMTNSINNGMDAAMFRAQVLAIVTEALG